MVTHNDFVEEELRKVLSDTMAELNKLEKDKDVIDNRIAQLQEEKHSYELALQNYSRRTGKQLSIEPNWDQLREARSHKMRLQILARYTGGTITVKDSSALFFNKGLIKSRRLSNAYQIVRGLLEGMVDEKVFEKVAQGKYRLINSQQTLIK